ncbi:MAG: hypothetical protein ACOX5G_06060 [Kiritimatiellia bacterium]
MIERTRGRWIGRLSGWIGVVGALLFLALSLVKGDWPFEPSRGGGWPVPLSVKACLPRSLLALVVGLALAWMPGLEPWRKRVGQWLFHSPRRRIQWVFGVAAFLLYAGIAWFRFKGLPYLDDDVAALFQARIFASGRIVLPLPEHGQFFDQFGLLGTIHGHPFVCTMYPPGLSLLLLPGVLAGVPWLMVPITGGLLVAATIALGAELLGERAGRLAGLFMLGSPFIGILAGTHLSHIPTALLLVVCWLAAVRLLRTGLTRHGVVAGAAWGAACLFRPLTALVVGAVIALGVMVQWRRALAAWRGVLAALLLAGAGVALLALWQHATVGDALTPGHVIGMRRYGSMGFVRFTDKLEHTPEIAWHHTLARMRAVNDRLLGWPLPAFALVLWALLVRRARPAGFWLFSGWLALLAIYAFYWYYEEYWPARYTTAGIPLLLILAARGWTLLRGNAGGTGKTARRARPVAHAVLAVGLAYAALVAWPWEWNWLGCQPGDMEHVLPRALEAFGIDRGIVFMRCKGRILKQGDAYNDYYAAGFIRNDLHMDGPLVFARNQRRDNELLMNDPSRGPFYLYTFHRATHQATLDQYVLVDGSWQLERMGQYPAEGCCPCGMP